MLEETLSYPHEFTDRLEVVWGVGFLSPGGPDEVREILRTVDLSGKTLLDIGCGVAGPAIVIANDAPVKRIIGIDIEPQLIERGLCNISAAGLDDKIYLQLVEPGPLPFDDETFDIVFSKDAMIHIEDKLALYREILRVLKPGGVLATSDWLVREDAESLPAFQRYLTLSHLKFSLQTAACAEANLRAAGFADVSSNDRNAWYVEMAREYARQVEGSLRVKLVEVCGEEIFQRMREISKANAEAAACGGLRPTHLRGTRPAIE